MRMIEEGHPTVIAIAKPPGITSAQVVSRIKRILGKKAKKVGHFGTLDPFAQGLLLIGLNGAMRLMEFVHELCPKTYLAKGHLGKKTDTGDLTGKVIAEEGSEGRAKAVTLESLAESSKKLVGEYWQAPHAFSATKFEGKALYHYARQGIVIEKEKVQRQIYQLNIKNLQAQEVCFEASVSTGTYIRVLFEEMAEACGSVGHLTELTRTQIGGVSLDQAMPWEVAQNEAVVLEDLQKYLLTPEELFPMPKLIISNEELYKKLLNGSAIACPIEDENDYVYRWVYLGNANVPLGLYKKEDVLLVPQFLF